MENKNVIIGIVALFVIVIVMMMLMLRVNTTEVMKEDRRQGIDAFLGKDGEECRLEEGFKCGKYLGRTFYVRDGVGISDVDFEFDGVSNIIYVNYNNKTTILAFQRGKVI